MGSKELEQLLERYWNCDTTLEEEQAIREMLSQKDIPTHLLIYRDLFLWQKEQSQLTADEGFSSRIENVIKGEDKKTIKISGYFYPVLKVAVSVLIVLSAGIGAYTHYQDQENLERTYSETYTDPELAIQETRAVLGIISNSLTKSQAVTLEALDMDSVRLAK